DGGLEAAVRRAVEQWPKSSRVALSEGLDDAGESGARTSGKAARIERRIDGADGSDPTRCAGQNRGANAARTGRRKGRSPLCVRIGQGQDVVIAGLVRRGRIPDAR